MTKAKIYSKINITLFCGEKEGGYHALDSIVCSTSLYDEVTVSQSDKTLTEGNIPEFCKDKFSAALNYLITRFSLPPIRAEAKSHIPLGCGMGGSSSLIAGLIDAVCAEFVPGITYEEKCGIADEFGSDAAFMLRGGAGRIKGRSRVSEFFSVAPVDALVVRKGFSDTKSVFKAYDEAPQSMDEEYGDALVRKLKNGRIDWFFSARNVLTDAAVKLDPYIGEALSLYPGAFMTGSGSGVVCAFASQKVKEDFEARGFECYPVTIGDFKAEVSKF